MTIKSANYFIKINQKISSGSVNTSLLHKGHLLLISNHDLTHVEWNRCLFEHGSIAILSFSSY